MLCIYNFLGTIKAIATVVLVVIIVGITIPGTEACSGGSEIITHEYHNTTSVNC